MEKLVKGDIIVIPFPFSDLSNSKRRPALVIANIKGDDLILCQITSKRSDEYSISLDKTDLINKKLEFSNIRTNRLFTADKSIVIYKLDHLKNNKIKQVEEKLIELFTS